ncbi:hypothetical protein BSLA_01f2410 [Burkholderia stabilis]|nr:hypothetical protein BSLA_01f2410 [Burkholderia stabilis]
MSWHGRPHAARCTHRTRVHQKSAEWPACTRMIPRARRIATIAPRRCHRLAAGAAPGPGIAQHSPVAASAGAIRAGLAHGWHGSCFIGFGRIGARCAKARPRSAR